MQENEIIKQIKINKEYISRLIEATNEDLSNKKGIIYLLFNIINDKVYIGKYCGVFYRRYYKDRSKWSNAAGNDHFKRALNKYSAINFKVFLLETGVTNEFERKILEEQYIEKFKSTDPKIGYNKTKGGRFDKLFVGEITKKSFESFESLSQKIHNKKYFYDKSTYDKRREKTQIICPEHGAFWQSPDSHLSGYGCYQCGRKSMVVKRNRTVKMIDPKTNQTLKIFLSLIDAAEYVNGVSTPIINVCKKKPKYITSYGYKWEYA